MTQNQAPENCSHYSSYELVRFLTADLPPAQEKRLRQHLAGCAACRRQMGEVAAVRSILQRSICPPLPRNFTISAQDLPARRPFLWYPLLRMATTAVAAAVLLLFLAGLTRPTDWTPTPQQAAGEPTVWQDLTSPPVAVDPMITGRPRPTWVTAPEPTVAAPTVGIASATSYPLPSTPAPAAQATVPAPVTTAPATAPGPVTTTQEPPQPPPADTVWPALGLGSLTLLGLVAGLTYLAYRREKAFFL